MSDDARDQLEADLREIKAAVMEQEPRREIGKIGERSWNVQLQVIRQTHQYFDSPACSRRGAFVVQPGEVSSTLNPNA